MMSGRRSVNSKSLRSWLMTCCEKRIGSRLKNPPPPTDNGSGRSVGPIRREDDPMDTALVITCIVAVLYRLSARWLFEAGLQRTATPRVEW